MAHDVLDQGGESALAFVVAGLLGNVGEDTGQVLVCVADEAALGGEVEEGFHDRQADQLRVADPGCDAHCWAVGGQVWVGCASHKVFPCLVASFSSHGDGMNGSSAMTGLSDPSVLR